MTRVKEEAIPVSRYPPEYTQQQFAIRMGEKTSST